MARRSHCTRFYAGLLTLAAATTACATGGFGSDARTGNTSQAQLTATEIRKAQFTNAYDAVRGLRPLFLNLRGPTSIMAVPQHDIVVIINDQVHGGVDELRTVPAVEVLWVRRLTASEVYFKLGRPAPSGGIEVRTLPCGDA